MRYSCVGCEKRFQNGDAIIVITMIPNFTLGRSPLSQTRFFGDMLHVACISNVSINTRSAKKFADFVDKVGQA